MAFLDDLKLWGEKIKSFRNVLCTEEAVKTALVMPFIQMLGYNIFNPTEVVPEFTADIGIKKGEKVDYAIMKNDEPHILIEVKGPYEILDSHNTQLYRYFNATPAKFAILTNGLIYKFFSDLDEPNKMDSRPFLVIDLENIKDQAITELEKFYKKKYDVDTILSTATELKYSNQIKEYLGRQIRDPDEDFIKFILRHVYEGRIYQSTMDKYSPIVKKSITLFISELLSDKIKTFLRESEKEGQESDVTEAEEVEEKEEKVPIITTAEEIEAYVIIRYLLRDNLEDKHKLTYKDTRSYFSITIDNNIRKWLCRINIQPKKKVIEFRNGEKIQIEQIQEIENYKEKFRNALFEVAENK